MGLGEFLGASIKNALGSAQNFMTPGVGSVYTGKVTNPISQAPGFGTMAPRSEGRLAAGISKNIGINIGNIAADSYTGTTDGLAGLSIYSGEDSKKAKTQLSVLQKQAEIFDSK